MMWNIGTLNSLTSASLIFNPLKLYYGTLQVGNDHIISIHLIIVIIIRYSWIHGFKDVKFNSKCNLVRLN